MSCRLVGGVLVWPLLIPAERVGLRALACYLCAELIFKMLDHARSRRDAVSDDDRLVDYACFLVPYPTLMIVRGWRERSRARWVRRRGEWLRALLAGGLFVLCFVVLRALEDVAVMRESFLIDHAVKFALFIFSIECLARSNEAVERLMGYRGGPVIDRAYASRSAAEFWCRFNTRVHRWMIRNVYEPVGGRRSAARGVLAVCFASAVFHELFFGIATSRLDGYQFVFFMVQGPAILLSRPLYRWMRRGGAGRVWVARAITVGWFFVTSALFFHGVDRVFPFFYASESWLP